MKKNVTVNTIIKKYNLVILLAIFIVISAILSPNFLTLGNFLNLLLQASIPGIVAIGMTLVILLGGIDLSVGSVLAFSGMMTSIVVERMGGRYSCDYCRMCSRIGNRCCNGTCYRSSDRKIWAA